jgi:hypothetical protein
MPCRVFYRWTMRNMANNIQRGNNFLSPEPPKPCLQLLGWKPVVKNTLRGFAHVELPIGLRITGIAVGESNGERWALLPTRPILDAGVQAKHETGKLQFAPFMSWKTAEPGKRFSKTVVELVQAAHPDSFGVP